MKQLMTRVVNICLFFSFLFVGRIFAYDFQVDGLYYTITDKATGSV